MTAPNEPSRVGLLFAYGTLLPGDERWPLLRRFAADTGRDDAVRGRLHDTGLGYPAAVFDTTDAAVATTGGGTGGSWVFGRTFALVEATLDLALAELDVEEDTVEGLFRRVEVTTRAGVRAWTYAYGTGLALTPIATGDWLTHRGLR